ncbi:MAG: hypothetical protein IKB84_00065 [Clostridia bacterium]|nr:hypothetical protein [Clostridia bacterium]MBR2849410.1 hypothetical protein [Clostridia bacterium]
MKKLLAIILALILCLSVAAVFTSCNSSDDKGADATDNNGADATEPEATEPPLSRKQGGSYTGVQ